MSAGRAPVPAVPPAAVLGRGTATRNPHGILQVDMGRVLDEFHALPNEVAQAAFADKWLSVAAHRLEQVWPMVYHLLRVVRDRQLWANPALLEGQRAFASFAEYFEARTGHTFGTWVDLEQTYAFVCAFKPELIDALYATAHQAKRAHDNTAADQQPTNAQGGQEGNENAVKCATETKHDNNKKSIMLRFPEASQGTSRTYALRRLAKDRPDLHARCLAGELTAHAAMVQAGFRKPRPSRKRTPLDYLHIYWRQVAPEDRRRFLIEMLTPNERRALMLGLDEEEDAP